jgi:LysR family cys regulon transcriptional activator
LLDSSHLIGKNTTYFALRHGHYLRVFANYFIELCSPALDEELIRAGAAPLQIEKIND